MNTEIEFDKEEMVNDDEPPLNNECRSSRIHRKFSRLVFSGAQDIVRYASGEAKCLPVGMAGGSASFCRHRWFPACTDTY